MPVQQTYKLEEVPQAIDDFAQGNGKFASRDAELANDESPFQVVMACQDAILRRRTRYGSRVDRQDDQAVVAGAKAPLTPRPSPGRETLETVADGCETTRTVSQVRGNASAVSVGQRVL